jgi:hypothetical protein
MDDKSKEVALDKVILDSKSFKNSTKIKLI